MLDLHSAPPAETALGPDRPASVFRVLLKHCFDRFFDRESLSPQGEPEASLAQILGFLAVPGAFFVLLFRPLLIMRWELISVRFLFVNFSMVVMGFVMVFEWDALFPDRRDYQTLTPLPLPLRMLFLAKLTALFALLGVFLLDINAFAVLFWPGIDGGSDVLSILGCHSLVVLAAGLFMALAAGAVQGVLVTTLSGSALRRVSVFLQTTFMGVLVTLLIISPLVGFHIKDLVKLHHPVLYWFPGFWFIGLYETLRPATAHPVILGLAPFAVYGLVVSGAVFLLTYLPGYRRHARRVLETPQLSPSGPGRLKRAASAILDRIFLHRPVERAVFHFITATITRSAKHRLFLATYGGFGVALAVLNLASGKDGLLQLPLTLSFILVSGLRAAFNFPSELAANWACQVSESGVVASYLSAMRKWILLCGVPPLFVLLAPLELTRVPWPEALFPMAFGLALIVLLIDLVFTGFHKVPFACAYFPGKINFTGLAVIYVFGFTTYSRTMAALEVWLLDQPMVAALFFVSAFILHRALVFWRDRRIRDSAGLTFEDSGDPVVRTLDLTAP